MKLIRVTGSDDSTLFIPRDEITLIQDTGCNWVYIYTRSQDDPIKVREDIEDILVQYEEVGAVSDLPSSRSIQGVVVDDKTRAAIIESIRRTMEDFKENKSDSAGFSFWANAYNEARNAKEIRITKNGLTFDGKEQAFMWDGNNVAV